MGVGRAIIIIIVVVCVWAASTAAQTPDRRTPQQMQASYDAHKGDFDYLLGDWEFSAVSREFGNFRGFWSALRLRRSNPRRVSSCWREGRDVLRHVNTAQLQQGARSMGVGRDGCGKRIAGCLHGSPRRRRNPHRAAVRCDERSAFDVEDSVLRHRARSILVDRRSLDRRRQDVAGEASDDRSSPTRTAPLARSARTGEEQRDAGALEK